MDWFYVIGGGPLDNSKMHQFHGFPEAVIQVPDPFPDYCDVDPKATTHAHKNHRYVRQMRDGRKTYCYKYAGVMT